jgi:hypothetical protein
MYLISEILFNYLLENHLEDDFIITLLDMKPLLFTKEEINKILKILAMSDFRDDPLEHITERKTILILGGDDSTVKGQEWKRWLREYIDVGQYEPYYIGLCITKTNDHIVCDHIENLHLYFNDIQFDLIFNEFLDIRTLKKECVQQNIINKLKDDGKYLFNHRGKQRDIEYLNINELQEELGNLKPLYEEKSHKLDKIYSSINNKYKNALLNNI